MFMVIKKELEKKGDTINYYTCQKCGREFICKEDHKIQPGNQPKCDICIGKLKEVKDDSVSR